MCLRTTRQDIFSAAQKEPVEFPKLKKYRPSPEALPTRNRTKLDFDKYASEFRNIKSAGPVQCTTRHAVEQDVWKSFAGAART